MKKGPSLQRFIDAQAGTYETAFSEIKHGRKRGHWMWFIFPQIKGLGHSETSRYYALTGLEEAGTFLQHPLLGPRLTTICNELLKLESCDATQIFGSPDDIKLKSSMTLFAALKDTDPVFDAVLKQFFNDGKDVQTLAIIGDR